MVTWIIGEPCVIHDWHFVLRFLALKYTFVANIR